MEEKTLPRTVIEMKTINDVTKTFLVALLIFSTNLSSDLIRPNAKKAKNPKKP